MDRYLCWYFKLIDNNSNVEQETELGIHSNASLVFTGVENNT